MHAAPKRQRNTGQIRSAKALTNEDTYPNIVELAITTDGLDVALGRRITQFHLSRHIQHDMFIIAGAFPIRQALAPSSKSSAERCAKPAFELNGQAFKRATRRGGLR